LTSPLITGAANTRTQREKTKKMARITSLGIVEPILATGKQTESLTQPFLKNMVIIVKNELGAQLQTLCAWMGEASSQISDLNLGQEDFI
jgi:hypothetical protein